MLVPIFDDVFFVKLAVFPSSFVSFLKLLWLMRFLTRSSYMNFWFPNVRVLLLILAWRLWFLALFWFSKSSFHFSNSSIEGTFEINIFVLFRLWIFWIISFLSEWIGNYANIGLLLPEIFLWTVYFKLILKWWMILGELLLSSASRLYMIILYFWFVCLSSFKSSSISFYKVLISSQFFVLFYYSLRCFRRSTLVTIDFPCL